MKHIDVEHSGILSFCEEVAEQIKSRLELTEEDVRVQSITKNNGFEKHGVNIRNSDGNAVPVFYLDDAFHEYLAGKSVEEIVEEVIEFIKLHQSKNISIPTEYDDAKLNLYAQIVNRAANEELLKNVPHRLLADGELAVIVRVRVDLDGDKGSYLVKNELLEHWMVTRDELIDHAISNTIAVEASFKGMGETLRETMGIEIDDEMISSLFPSEDEKMYVLTNPDKVFGASMLLNKDLLASIKERLGDYYIIPSSIHEVIIVPESAGVDLECLEQMVHDVNMSEVAPEDILSDRVFQFNAKTNRLEIAGQHKELKEEKAHKKSMVM